MKPRYEETSKEVDRILRKAKSLADRADKIEKELVKNVTSYTTQPHSPEFHIVQGESSRRNQFLCGYGWACQETKRP